MAKKRTSKKANKKKRTSSRPAGKGVPGRKILIAVICIVLVGGIFYGARHFFLNSKFFEIKEIAVNKDRGYSFSSGENKLRRLYLGRNIFTVDLVQVQTLIKNDFPYLKKVEARRSLPEVLEINIVSREPAAVIDTGGGIVIDSDGVVLTIGEETKNLVKIKGISFFLNMPSRGESINNSSLDEALDLLGEINNKLHITSRKNIEYIDVSRRNNIVLGISGVPVKMGTRDFSEKVIKLRQILRDPKIDMKDINYIDLRFDDAVISPK